MAVAAEQADVLRTLRLLDRRAELTRRSPIDFYEALPHGRAFHDAPHKERWVVGGNRSGKTEMGAAEVVLLVTGRADWWTEGPHEVWCSTTTHAKSVEVQRPKVRKFLPPGLIKRWVHEHDPRSESVLELTSGWIIRFKADQQGAEAFASGSAALVWHDEEPSPGVFDESRMRTIDCRGRIVVTFTPTNGLRWKDAYERIYLRWLAFRARHPKAKWGAISEHVFVVTAATEDNPWVPPDEIAIIRKECAHRPSLLRARLGGEWIDITEDSIVPVDDLLLWSVAPPAWRRKVGWIDTASSRRDTACEFAIASAGMGPEGGLYLIDYRHGKYDAHKRMKISLDFIAQEQLTLVFTQDPRGDALFADHLNDRLRQAASPCVVKLFPYDGPIPSKEERAQVLASYVGAQRVFVRPEHADFRAEAASFPAGATNDLFDACMGALMALLAIPDASIMADAIRGQVRRDERGRRRGQGEDLLYQPSGHGGILRERL